MSTRRGKAVFGIGAVVAGLLVFLVASAYLISRDQPKWLAAAVGALGFPVLPLAWQIFGEHRRKRAIAAAKTPPKSTLSAGDRYVMRAFVVTLAVLGPMFVAGRFDVLRGAWNNKTWFLPEPTFDERKQELLTHVPSDAELVLVIHSDDDKPKPGAKPGVGVVAYGDHQLAVIVPDDGEMKITDDKLKELNDQRDKIPFLKIDPVGKVDISGDLLALASERWKSKVGATGTGPSAEILAELERAPADAKVVIAFVPTKSPERLDIKRASAWLEQAATNEKVVIEARVEAVNAKAAETFVDLARAMWKAKSSEVPAKCRDEVNEIVGDVKIDRVGTVITFKLVVPPDKLMGLMFCAMKSD
jgi:hypothetical protein